MSFLGIRDGQKRNAVPVALYNDDYELLCLNPCLP